MKFLGICFVLVAAFTSTFAVEPAKSICSVHQKFNDADQKIFNNWVSLKDSCLEKMIHQIGEEIGASLKYLSMAAHFSNDQINRPGFAKMYFDAASEEREHAIKLIEYLSMRGRTGKENGFDISDFRKLPSNFAVPKVTTGESSLLKALEMETAVTNSIVGVIQECEATKCIPADKPCDKPKHALTNDYHLVDYLTGVYLEEQYKGQKEIADHLSTLNKMTQVHKETGEFIFDKKLLME